MCSDIWLILVFPRVSGVASGRETETDGDGRDNENFEHVGGEQLDFSWGCCQSSGLMGAVMASCVRLRWLRFLVQGGFLDTASE